MDVCRATARSGVAGEGATVLEGLPVSRMGLSRSCSGKNSSRCSRTVSTGGRNAQSESASRCAKDALRIMGGLVRKEGERSESLGVGGLILTVSPSGALAVAVPESMIVAFVGADADELGVESMVSLRVGRFEAEFDLDGVSGTSVDVLSWLRSGDGFGATNQVPPPSSSSNSDSIDVSY